MAKKKDQTVQSTIKVKESDNKVVTIDIQPFLMPLSLLISSIIISVAIIIASNNIRGLSSSTLGDTSTSDEVTPTTTGEEFPAATTTIDDDARMGNRDTAKVAIVEFSDYECPFCKRHFEQTYPELKSKYIDTGKAILVFRDFPLSFHDPLATKQALAAECVQDIAGDAAYFKFHDLVFTTTTSNGQGMQESKLFDLATQAGVDSGKVKECYDANKFADEIAKDVADGQKAGVSGTPGFIVGVLKSDGTVEGKRIDGAYPFTSFQTILDEMIEKAG